MIVMPAKGLDKQVRALLCIDSISVTSPERREASVPGQRNRVRRSNQNIGWQSGIEYRCPAMSGNWANRIEMSNLSRRMHSRVGSSCPMQLYRGVKHRGDRPLYLFLNRPLMRLSLPAMKMCSLVLNDQGNSLLFRRLFHVYPKLPTEGSITLAQ